ncbi:hypothetical protein [Polyangium aurulentum]|uniref:hypothetical protein n=1 Tax=Polyangium aurulentum TaxID=2567896 RepID=UPI0010AE0D3B|nr:hypothetical protein [Polyangium aurulentum]UQA54711.1 hypothetical protein E8A73_025400 [Polyangium aurulentum]
MSEDKPAEPAGEAKPAAAPRGLSKRKKIALAVLGALLLGGGSAFARWGVPRIVAGREAKGAGAALHRCLFGNPPAPGENAARRLRRILLSAAGLPGEARPRPEGDAWPGRCAPHARKLADALQRAGSAKIAPPDDLMQKVLAKARDTTSPTEFPLDALWAMAEGDGPEDVPKPPTPASPLDLDAPNFAERIAFADHSSDFVPGRGLRLIFRGDHAGPMLACALPEGLADASCAPIDPRARARAPRPLLWPAADDGGPSLVTDRSSARSTFYRTDTGQAFGAEYRVAGGYAAEGGLVGLVEVEVGTKGEEKALWLARYQDDKALGRTKIEPKPRARWANVSVLGDRLVWMEPRGRRPHLFVRHLGAQLGPIEDAGELPHDAVKLSACKTREGIALLARDGSSVWITFRSERGGSPLRRVDEPARPAGAEMLDASFTCEDSTAAATVVLRSRASDKASYEVRRIRCSKEGCEIGRVALDDLNEGRDPLVREEPLPRDVPVLGASIGDAMLVVWRTAAAGVRARLARPDEIGNAPDLVIYDEQSQDVNGAGRLHAMRLYARPGAALLLLHAVSGIKAIRIGADGSFRALRAKGG